MLISLVHKPWVAEPFLAIWVSVVAGLLFASPSAAPWTQPGYLYRYFVWGAQWVADSTTPDPNDHRPWETFARWQDKGGYYKYFWWGISQGNTDYSYMGIGTYGQFIFVSPRTRVVIVRTADNDGIDPPQWREVFQYIAGQIDRSYSRETSATR